MYGWTCARSPRELRWVLATGERKRTVRVREWWKLIVDWRKGRRACVLMPREHCLLNLTRGRANQAGEKLSRCCCPLSSHCAIYLLLR